MSEQREDVPMMPVYQAEKIIMHQNFANRRMLIALIVVIIGMLVFAIVFSTAMQKQAETFVNGYNARTKDWLNTLKDLKKEPAETEYIHGVQQDADP